MAGYDFIVIVGMDELLLLLEKNKNEKRKG